jgi:hypothetical protein
MILPADATPKPDEIFGKDNYNKSRIHRSLDKDSPFHRAIERVGVITFLGGLHHQYCKI